MKELTTEQRQQFEQWHDSGKMPDWAYYQQVNVPWYVSIPAQIEKFKKEIDAGKQQAQIEARINEEAEKRAIEMLKQFAGGRATEDAVANKIADIVLADFQQK